MTMEAVWTIVVGGGDTRKYKTINFKRNLEKDGPTEFDAVVEYDSGNPIDFFDLVQIKRNGTVEWKGFVESIEIEWSKKGRYYIISGRDTTLILWKKWNESFTKGLHDEGFFGKVSASELIRFLLRTPKSDAIFGKEGEDNYPFNQEGWGIDSSRIVSCKAQNTAIGDPNWVRLRRKGSRGWQNSGAYKIAEKYVNGVESNTWETDGDSPYLNDSDANQINSKTDNQMGIFTFADLSDATAVTKVVLAYEWKADFSWWWFTHGEFWIYIWIHSESRWQYLCLVQGRSTPWYWWSNDVSNYIKTVSDVDNCKVKFVNKSESTRSRIRRCHLTVSYVELGSQGIDDVFDISFAEESIVGVYIESRINEETFPRKYKITTVTGKEPFDGYTEEPAEGEHITLQDDNKTIHHDNYQTETAYLYKDYGVGGLDNFTHLFGFKLTSRLYHPYCYIPWMVSNNLEDHKTAQDAGHYYLSLSVEYDPTNGLRIRAEKYDSGGNSESFSPVISLNTIYYCKTVKSQVSDNIKFYVYTDEAMTNLFWSETFSLDNLLAFKYRFQAMTWDGIDWVQAFSDSFENTLDNWTRSGQSAPADTGYSDVEKAHGTYSAYLHPNNPNELFYAEKEFPQGNPVRVQWYDYLPSPDSEAVNTVLPVDDWEFIHNDWTHHGTEPWLHDDDADTNYISMAILNSEIGDYDDYYGFANLDGKYEAINPTSVILYIKGRHFNHTGGDVRIKIHAWYNGAWHASGDLTLGSGWTTVGLGLTNVLNTVAKINGTRLKLEFSGFDGNEDGAVQITYAYLHVEGTAYWGRVDLCKVFDKDVAGTGNPSASVIGVAQAAITDTATNQDKYKYCIWGYDSGGAWRIESTEPITSGTWNHFRLEVFVDASGGYVKFYLVEDLKVEKTGMTNNTNGIPDCVDVEFDWSNEGGDDSYSYMDYAQIWTWNDTHSDGYIYSNADAEYELVPAVNNSVTGYRDLIHSWQPKTIDNLRIRITDSDAHPWSISQIYIYKAETLNYRVFVQAGESPTFSADQYIHVMTVVNSYSPAIGPLDIGMGRLLKSINKIVRMCHASYVPYRWWLETDSDNTFKIAIRKGEDKHVDVKFELGKQLKKSKRVKESDDTKQRIKVVGGGEGKTQQQISSDWKEDTSAMNVINSFYEEIVSGKSIASKELADLIAEIEKKKSASVSDQIVATISRDTHTSMDYDVGDDVQIIDELIGLGGSGATKRIHYIKKRIDGKGEDITLILGEPFKSVEDTWDELYSRLKDLELKSVIAGSLYGQGAQGDEIDVKKVTDFFEETAKNDTADLKKPQKDPAWYILVDGIDPTGVSYTDASGAPNYNAAKFLADKGVMWKKTDDWMAVHGTNSESDPTTFQIELWGAKETGVTGRQTIIYTRQNPKLTAEIKVIEEETGNPKYWKIGDYFDIGFGKNDVTERFCFRIKCVGAQTFKIYSRYYDKDGDWHEAWIMDIENNHKYRLELVIEWERKFVIFNVYDAESDIKGQEAISAIGYNITDVALYPLHMLMASTHSESSQRAVVYIYKFRSEWEA